MNGNSLIAAHDYMEQTGCDLAEALEALNWRETEIRRRELQSTKRVSGLPDIQPAPIDESLPF